MFSMDDISAEKKKQEIMNSVYESEDLTNVKTLKDFKEEKNFTEYLKVLSFHELMNESVHLMTEIKNDQRPNDLFSRTKIMMNEFSNRLEKESKQLAFTVKELKKEIERSKDRDGSKVP